MVKGQGDGIRIEDFTEGASGGMVWVQNTLCKENGGCGISSRVRSGMLGIQDCIMSMNTKCGASVEVHKPDLLNRRNT